MAGAGLRRMVAATAAGLLAAGICLMQAAAVAKIYQAQETSAPQSAPPIAAEMTVTDDGVGGIGAATPFDPMAVREELPPGYAVTMASPGAGDGSGMINVLRNDIPVLSLLGSDGHVSLIQILSPRVGVGPAAVGADFATFFRDAAEGGCGRGEARLSTMVICTPTERRQVNLLFEPPAGASVDDAPALPDDAALQSWILKYVIWSALPAPAPRPDAGD